MVMIVLIVVGYLGITRSDRATTSIYANRLRAKMMAESGLAAATHLLKDNTRYGNYITAMAPPLPSPAPRYTEVYRPTEPSDLTKAKADDFLQLSNAAGELLVSQTVPQALPTPSASPTPQVDPRPTPQPIPPAGPFVLPDPGLSSSDSYDFNQIVRLGNTDGRLVNPDAQPVFGQWVRVRNSAGELIGRYAFFIEDESMKVNVNVTGNNVGGSNMRVNDLASPTPSPTPPSQIEEVDPSAILPLSADRAFADQKLTATGSSGQRLSTSPTLALLDEWKLNNFQNYAHLVTVLSKDDNTTARGWRRLDLNALVASATDDAAKTAVARRIANWIRDAWTGPSAIASLQDYQMYGDDWSRQQIAANIVDYIDADSTPTDMGNVAPATFAPVPVIGLEKSPYLAAVEIIYQASGSTYPGSGSGNFTATLKMKIQFRFFNMFDTTIDLADSMGSTPSSRIEVRSIPIVQKNGGTVYDASAQTWTIRLSDLTPINGTGTTVSPGTDGQTTSGARTFQSPWLDTRSVSFTVSPSGDQLPRFAAGSTTVKVIGNRGGSDYRIDDTTITINQISTGYYRNSGGNSAGDFLKDSNSTNGPLQIASINYIAGYQGEIYAGSSPWDSRYRARLVNDRWNNNGRTDATYPCPWITPAPTQDRITAFIDTAEVNPRAYAFDWFDYAGTRPLGFIRNGPMLNVGEIGNVAACEYQWRTPYLQYPERPANTTSVGPVTDIPLRRSHSVDYVLTDLFRTNSMPSRTGAININTQQRYGSTQQHALAPLFLSEMIGTVPSLTQTMLDRLCTNTGAAGMTTILDHRSDSNTPMDNTPLHPFFQPGEIASVLSRLVNTSPGGSGTTGSPSRSTVNYCFLRSNPSAPSESPTNNNIHSDMLAEQEFREISNSITTKGNVFRVLYVGQALKNSSVQAEYLGEAFVERQGVFTVDSSNSDIMRTTDSIYRIIANRVIME